jgi:hypothetical protein
MHHSAGCVNTICLRRSLRPCGAPRGQGQLATALTWGFTGRVQADASMMRLVPWRGVRHRCAC